MRRGDQSVTETCKCSAGHAGWGMLTGRHPAPHCHITYLRFMEGLLLRLPVYVYRT
nr:MAG TPA_asm: hypothetical protein [Caudoviricetes sp.]